MSEISTTITNYPVTSLLNIIVLTMLFGGAVLVVTGSIIGVKIKAEFGEMRIAPIVTGIIFVAAGVILFFGLGSSIKKYEIELNNEKIQQAREFEIAIKSDYDFYLDGNEVEYENIDPDDYNYTVNSEKHAVYLKEKSNSNYFIFLPFIMMLFIMPAILSRR